MEEKKKSGRGGARPGAGRKKVYAGGKKFAFNAGAFEAKVIDAQEDKTAFINACIKKCIAGMKEEEEQSEPDLTRMGAVYSADNAKMVMPVYETAVACGQPIDARADEGFEVVDLVKMFCPSGDAYIVNVRGNSMIEDDIHDGDMIVVDTTYVTPQDGRPMLCDLNDEYTVKFVEKSATGYTLIPANPCFGEIEVCEDDKFRICGMVTWVIHQPRLHG